MLERHILILSLPRSGSTVLTNQLDAREDVLCLPECFFPAALDLLQDREMREKRFVGALFVASCPDGSPLTIDEAEACIRDTKVATVEAIADAVATKRGRDPAGIRVVVWKSTRMVGCRRLWSESGGRFVILTRPALNVYESQFRVHFGAKNRNPVRFAFFEASYLVAFRGYPADKTFRLAYGTIPERMGDLARWMGSSGVIRPNPGDGGVRDISGKQYWQANIGKPFRNDDAEKIKNLAFWRKAAYHVGRGLFAMLPPVTGWARRIADDRQMLAMRGMARQTGEGNHRR